MKEILVYSNINSWSASDFINAMTAAADSDISVRVNCDGGDPDYGFGMISKFIEHKGKKLVKVDSKCHSMMAMFLCYADDSEALEMSTMLVHRAAYPDWYENNPELFTDNRRAEVQRVNDFYRKAFEAKVDVAKFEELKGVKVKDIFSLDDRIDVVLTAQEAKKIGLINRTIKITPQKSAEITSLTAKMAAKYSGGDKPAPKAKKTIETIKSKKMNLSEFKTKYPKTYAAALKAGAAQENDRINACLVYVDVDPAGVKEAIKSGKPLTQTQMAEFSLKALNGKKVADIAADATADVVTKEDPKGTATEAVKKQAEISAALDKELGLTAKK